jgi:hypothetical protein
MAEAFGPEQASFPPFQFDFGIGIPWIPDAVLVEGN